jgi:hypothetical protein
MHSIFSLISLRNKRREKIKPKILFDIGRIDDIEKMEESMSFARDVTTMINLLVFKLKHDRSKNPLHHCRAKHTSRDYLMDLLANEGSCLLYILRSKIKKDFSARIFFSIKHRVFLMPHENEFSLVCIIKTRVSSNLINQVINK